MQLPRYAECGVATRPATPPLSAGVSPMSVGNEAVAGEGFAGLDEREIRRRQDHVGLLEHVVADRRAFTAYEVEHRVKERVEALLIPGLNGRDGVVVELVELVRVVIGDLVLALRGDADDHAGFSVEGAAG